MKLLIASTVLLLCTNLISMNLNYEVHITIVKDGFRSLMQKMDIEIRLC